jgi:hypothetical protein
MPRRCSSVETHSLGEDAHEVVFEREVEARGTRVALTAGAAAKLVVDAARLVALGAEDVRPPASMTASCSALAGGVRGYGVVPLRSASVFELLPLVVEAHHAGERRA